MDMSVIVVIWLVVMVIQNVFEKKKPPPPPPPQDLPPDSENNFPGFRIPTLANDPNFPNEEPQILIQDTTQSAEVREIDMAELYRQKKLAAQIKANNSVPQVQNKISEVEVERKNFSIELTPSATMNALILGEILSKPKFRK